jgi:hypothetical protein
MQLTDLEMTKQPRQTFFVLMGMMAACDPGESPTYDDEQIASEEFELEVGFVEQNTTVSINANVPYLKQLDYDGIGASACAPTSLAMILRYYYPNSNIDVWEIYHAGLQSYDYHGPARGYRNLSWGMGDPEEAAIVPGYQNYYSGLGYSGASGTATIRRYLDRIWGINSDLLNTEQDLYSSLANGPVIGHVWAHGDKNSGHYLVIRGYDDKGTPDHADDTIYVNDPYHLWWPGGTGENQPISHHDFFVKWFRDAIVLHPQDTEAEREYTIVVDSGHNPTSGSPSPNRFEVDFIDDVVGNTNVFTWWMKYEDNGDYYFPKESGHAARWTPELAVSGKYKVAVKYIATPSSGNVTYHIHDAAGDELLAVTIDQHANAAGWTWAVLSSSIALSDGAYVRATDIAAYSNIDAVKFKYVGP